jgi:hypothetical protein
MAEEFFKRTSVRAVSATVWGSFEQTFGQTQKNIASSLNIVHRELDISLKEEAKASRQTVEASRQTVDASYASLKRIETVLDGESCHYLRNLRTKIATAENVLKIGEWLSPIDVASSHEAARKLHHLNTNNWFLESSKFQTWLGEEDGFLWVNAPRMLPRIIS